MDVIANLLFADGCAALLIENGDEPPLNNSIGPEPKETPALQIVGR